MTIKQVEWAASHDWYLGVDTTGCQQDGFLVRVHDSAVVGGISTFSEFKALKAWAGY